MGLPWLVGISENTLLLSTEYIINVWHDRFTSLMGLEYWWEDRAAETARAFQHELPTGAGHLPPGWHHTSTMGKLSAIANNSLTISHCHRHHLLDADQRFDVCDLCIHRAIILPAGTREAPWLRLSRSIYLPFFFFLLFSRTSWLSLSRLGVIVDFFVVFFVFSNSLMESRSSTNRVLYRIFRMFKSPVLGGNIPTKL